MSRSGIFICMCILQFPSFSYSSEGNFHAKRPRMEAPEDPTRSYAIEKFKEY